MKIFSRPIGVSLAWLVGIAVVLVYILLVFEDDIRELWKGPYQKSLDKASFHFKDEKANAQYSVTHFSGDCQVQMIDGPHSPFDVTFKFVRAGKEILVLEGSGFSVFRGNENTLFFAHFCGCDCGCAVAAYDLDNDREIWRIELEGIGRPAHFVYTNRVTMDLSNADGRGEGVISVAGSESFGDYVEVLDQKTGKQLAHRVYSCR